MDKGNRITWVVCIAIILASAAIIIAYKMPEKAVTYDNLKYEDYISSPEYKDLSIKGEKAKVTDEELNKYIQSEVDSKSTTKDVKKGTAEKGDTVRIDYTGYVGDEKFIGGSAEDYELELGSGTMVDGFEEGIIGKKIGEETTITVTFPEDYKNNQVAGQDVRFDIDVKAKVVPVTYSYDDEFIKKFTDCKTKKEYETAAKKQLLKEKKNNIKMGLTARLWEQVTDSVKVKEYPKEQYVFERDSYIADQKAAAQNYGVEWDVYLSDYIGMTEDEFIKSAKNQAKRTVKEKLIAYDIAQKENISVTTKDTIEWLKKTLKESDVSVEEFEEEIGKSLKQYVRDNDIKSYVIQERVQELLYDKADIK